MCSLFIVNQRNKHWFTRKVVWFLVADSRVTGLGWSSIACWISQKENCLVVKRLWNTIDNAFITVFIYSKCIFHRPLWGLQAKWEDQDFIPSGHSTHLGKVCVTWVSKEQRSNGGGHMIEGLGCHSEILGFLSQMGNHLSRQMAHISMESHCLRSRGQGQKQGDQSGAIILILKVAAWLKYGSLDEDDEKWSDSKCIWKVELTVFADGISMEEWDENLYLDYFKQKVFDTRSTLMFWLDLVVQCYTWYSRCAEGRMENPLHTPTCPCSVQFQLSLLRWLLVLTNPQKMDKSFLPRNYG